MSAPRPLKVKVVTVGDSGVGKTSIILQIDGQGYSTNVISSLGASYVSSRTKLNGREVCLQIWDTAGQERFRSMVPLYSRNARAAIIVFDVTNRESFDNVPAWIKELQKGSTTDIELIILMANKVDLTDLRIVSKQQGVQMSQEFGAAYFETSAKDGTGIENAVFKIASMVSETMTESANTLKIISPDEQSNAEQKKTKCCGWF